MFSLAVRLNIEVSCVTTLMHRRKLFCVTSLIFWPSIEIFPLSGSCNRKRVETSVDFPAPEAPTTPSFSPGFMSSETFLIPPTLLP